MIVKLLHTAEYGAQDNAPAIGGVIAEGAVSMLEVRLFGRFSIRSSGRTMPELDAGKAQELLSYLLLHRDRPHPRESLSDLLWGERCGTQAKKYLRHALWQIHTTLDGAEDSPGRLVQVEPDWVHLNTETNLWLDVEVFECTAELVHTISGRQFDATAARAAHAAVDLYQGDLLEDWYQDWCLFERERLQNIDITLLDKLMVYSDTRQEWESGIEFGSRILRLDGARERTHRGLMRLHYLAGDRTAALRQYDRCTMALEEELGVGPARSTRELYEQIRSDRVGELPNSSPSERVAEPSVADALGRIGQLQDLLVDLQTQMHQLQEAIGTTHPAS